MKYLVLLVVVLVVLGVWRKRRDPLPGTSTPPSPSAPQAMVACAHCGVHIPAKDALHSQHLMFCSEAHRLLGPAR